MVREDDKTAAIMVMVVSNRDLDPGWMAFQFLVRTSSDVLYSFSLATTNLLQNFERLLIVF